MPCFSGSRVAFYFEQFLTPLARQRKLPRKCADRWNMLRFHWKLQGGVFEMPGTKYIGEADGTCVEGNDLEKVP